MASLLDRSGGSISRLCDTMAECVKRFRERVRGALRTPDQDEAVDESASCRVRDEGDASVGARGAFWWSGRVRCVRCEMDSSHFNVLFF